MNLAIVGATGRAGLALVRQALAERHKVTALARDPAKIARLAAGLLVVPGDVDGPRTDRYQLGYPRLGAELAVSREDLAACLLAQVTDDAWLRQAPITSYPTPNGTLA